MSAPLRLSRNPVANLSTLSGVPAQLGRCQRRSSSATTVMGVGGSSLTILWTFDRAASSQSDSRDSCRLWYCARHVHLRHIAAHGTVFAHFAARERIAHPARSSPAGPSSCCGVGLDGRKQAGSRVQSVVSPGGPWQISRVLLMKLGQPSASAMRKRAR